MFGSVRPDIARSRLGSVMAYVADRRCQILDALNVHRDLRQPLEHYSSGIRLIPFSDPKRAAADSS